MIRPAGPVDAGEIARVHTRSWQAAYAHVFPAERLAEISVEGRTEHWREILAGDTPTLVADENGEVLGFAGLGPSRDSDGDGELYAIYVDPSHWSSGVGHALVESAEAKLREAGHAQATLWVLDDNPKARRFYERHGWRLDGTTRTGEHLGVETREVRYSKRL